MACKQKVESEDFTVDVETLDSESLHEPVPEKAVCSMMVLILCLILMPHHAALSGNKKVFAVFKMLLTVSFQ